MVHLTPVKQVSLSPEVDIRPDEVNADADDEYTSSDEDAHTNQYLLDLAMKKGSNPRARAAPFLDELAPGWRARARELAPPYSKRRKHAFVDTMAPDEDGVPELGSVDSEEGVGGRKDGEREDEEQAGEESGIHLGYEEGRARRASPQGTRNDGGKSREGDSDNLEGENSSTSQTVGSPGGPVGSDASWSRKTGQRGSNQAVQGTGSLCGRCDEASDDVQAQGPSGRENYTLDNDSGDSEYEVGGEHWPNGSRRGMESGRGRQDPCEKEMRSPLKWARQFVTDVTGRAKTIVDKIFVSSDDKMVYSESERKAATVGKESWTAVEQDAAWLDNKVTEGLEKPCWRESVDVDTEEVIESRPVNDSGIKETFIEDAPRNIKTTIWYGTGKPKSQNVRSSEKFRRTITKGIRLATAIFLLEATVLLASGAQWTGSWTQRLYGTGSADVWEVFGDHGRVSDVSWRQGWRVLEPLRQAHFGDEMFQETLNVTLLERESLVCW